MNIENIPKRILGYKFQTLKKIGGDKINFILIMW